MSATGLLDPESKDLRRAFKARRRTELGLLVAASVIITCRLCPDDLREHGQGAERRRPPAGRHARPRGGGPPGQPDLRPERQPGRPAHRLPAQRARLRDDPPHRPGQHAPPLRLCPAAGGVDGRRGGRLRHHPGRDPSVPRPRPLPLHPARPRGHPPPAPPGAPPRDQPRPHRRGPPVGALRTVRVPAGGAGQDPAGASSSPPTSPRSASCSPSRRPGSATGWSSTPAHSSRSSWPGSSPSG